jgi:hypothetical protein
VVAALEEGVEATVRVIRAQRTATLELLQRHARAKAEAARHGQLARLLAVDLLIAHAEADAAWLDRCEARVLAAAGGPGKEVAR